jgi:hypothetical protein
MIYTWDVFLEEADADTPPQWIGTIQGDSQVEALFNAAQFYEKPEHDLVVHRQPNSTKEWDRQAIQAAVDQAPKDMIMTPVRVTFAGLYKKTNVTGEDLQVQGLRWYIELELENTDDRTTAAALYRVWFEQGQWRTVRVELR